MMAPSARRGCCRCVGLPGRLRLHAARSDQRGRRPGSDRLVRRHPTRAADVDGHVPVIRVRHARTGHDSPRCGIAESTLCDRMCALPHALSEWQVMAVGVVLDQGRPTVADVPRRGPGTPHRTLQRDSRVLVDRSVLWCRGYSNRAKSRADTRCGLSEGQNSRQTTATSECALRLAARRPLASGARAAAGIERSDLARVEIRRPSGGLISGLDWLGRCRPHRRRGRRTAAVGTEGIAQTLAVGLGPGALTATSGAP